MTNELEIGVGVTAAVVILKTVFDFLKDRKSNGKNCSPEVWRELSEIKGMITKIWEAYLKSGGK